MGVRRWHVERDAVHEEHIPSGEIPYTDLKDKTIQLVLDIPMLFERQSVAADAVGIQDIYDEPYKLRSEHIKHLKSAEFIINYAWAATADGTIQLYDSTAAAVLAESTTKTGGESVAFEVIDITGTLVAGNVLHVRVNITVAGAAGETTTVKRAWIRLILGIK